MSNTETPQHQSQNQKLDAIIKRLESLEREDKASTRFEYLKFSLTALASLVVFGVGLFQYIDTSALTAQQPYIKKQMDLCLKASEAAARLATTPDQTIWKKSRDEFEMLHWGPLEIVEEADKKDSQTQPVVDAMKDFRGVLEPLDLQPPALPVSSLLSPSNHIAFACRDLIRSKWSLGLTDWLNKLF
jgi:hypothetical protein